MNADTAILYVEDDPKSRKVMEMALKLRLKLANVTIFEDSHQFMERVEALMPRPNIILLDIHVKPLSGFEMLRVLREHEQFKYVPIAALTASVMNEEVHELQIAGFDGCFSKPLNVRVFHDALQRLLAGERLW